MNFKNPWLQSRGFAPGQILVLGKSLGGGVASELALREPIGALILQSTFTSIAEIGADLYPWLPVRWLHHIHYDTLSKLPRIRAPILILHSRGDRLISFRHAERNFAAANAPKALIEIEAPSARVVSHDARLLGTRHHRPQQLAVIDRQTDDARRGIKEHPEISQRLDHS